MIIRECKKMLDKSIKIRNIAVKPDLDLIQYMSPPCKWRYHRCSDFNKKCKMCSHNEDLYPDPKIEKRKKSHFHSIRPVE